MTIENICKQIISDANFTIPLAIENLHKLAPEVLKMLVDASTVCIEFNTSS